MPAADDDMVGLMHPSHKLGRAMWGTDGRRAGCIANHGLTEGDRAVMPLVLGCRGFAVRVLGTVQPLLTHESVLDATEALSKGRDSHAVARLLHHDDPSTVAALIAGWHREWGVDLPPIVAGADVSTLSGPAADRLKCRRTDPIPAPVVVDALGCDNVGSPLVPVEWLDRRFASGDELQNEAEVAGVLHPRQLCTYGMHTAPRNEWMDADSATRSAAALGVPVRSVVRLRVAGDGVAVDVSGEEGAVGWRAAEVPGAMYRLVCGAPASEGGEWRGGGHGKSQAQQSEPLTACVIVLCADQALLEGRPPAKRPGDQGTHSGSLVALPPPAVRNLVLPASTYAKAIRRGRSLCPPTVLIESLHQLLGADTHQLPNQGLTRTSGAMLALWRLFTAVFIDSCPYRSDDAALPINAIAGLALLAHSDPDWFPPAFVVRQIAETSVRLLLNDGPTHLWPWRGWRHESAIPSASALRIEGSDEPKSVLCDSIRLALIALPATKQERLVLYRYLGVLTGRNGNNWAKALRKLPEMDVEGRSLVTGVPCSAPTPLPSSARGLVDGRVGVAAVAAAAAVAVSVGTDLTLSKELALSAFDAAYRPSILLLLQASLPNPPREATQHSLRALASVMWRLSSGVNARQLRQRHRGAVAATIRFQNMVTGGMEAAADDEVKGLGEDEEAPPVRWCSSWEALVPTDHERVLMQEIEAIQTRFVQADVGEAAPRQVQQAVSPADDPARGKGREPTVLERRTAFLQLFGSRLCVSPTDSAGKPRPVFVTLAGTPADPFVVQRAGAGQVSAAEAAAGVQDSGKVARESDVGADVAAAARKLALDVLSSGQQVERTLPPPGFVWSGAAAKGQRLRICVKCTDDRYVFSVEGVEVPAFDAGALLAPCSVPVSEIPLSGDLLSLVGEALYCDTGRAPMPGIQLLESLDAWSRQQKIASCDVYQWRVVAASGRLERQVWRDLWIKLATREGEAVEVSRCTRDGERSASALQQMSEGTLLRLLYCLAALYPHALTRQTELKFRICACGVHFAHMQREISVLAFGSYDDGETVRGPAAAAGGDDCSDESYFSFEAPTPSPSTPPPPTDATPGITTKLWPHQAEAVGRVLQGVGEGKRGFADASAVGAGKSLTALACCTGVSDWLRDRGLKRQGFLVLVPSNDLIGEWVQQALQHTKGLHVVVQQHQGRLISRGVSAGGGIPSAHSSSKRGSGRRERPDSNPLSPWNFGGARIDHNTVVVTTLARARDKPMIAQAGWDLVIVDECLSVQNDSALQTMEAWRQVAASRCGVLLLSATFFRSRFSKLFYMVRMLRSPLPRTEPYLPALLTEHVICYVPKQRRTWRLDYAGVPLDVAADERYQARVKAAARQWRSPLVAFAELKQALRDSFDTTTLIEAFRERCESMVAAGRRPLIFANTEAEAERIAAVVPDARRWGDEGGAKHAKMKKAGGPLIVTVARGAYGLNLQDQADCIICRPQPGDLVEQMKGRIDRPGQSRRDLILVVLFAQGTVEEAEAANIRLCGAFFRQYLCPLSRPFAERAVNAAISAHGDTKVPFRRGAQLNTAVAKAFRRSLAMDVGTSVELPDEADGDDETASAPQPQSTPEKAGPARRRAAEADSGTPPKKRQRRTGTDAAAADALPSQATPEKATPKRRRRAADADGSSPPKRKRKGADEAAADASPPKRRQKAAAAAAEEPEPCPADSGSEGEPAEPRPAAPKQLTPGAADEAVKWLMRRDRTLAGIISAVGPPTGLVEKLGTGPFFIGMIRSVVFQQISVTAATSIFKRLCAHCGGERDVTPGAVAAATTEDLRKVGLSGRKCQYVRAIAEKFVDETLSDEKLRAMDDDELMRALMSLPGFGEWSTHMFMIFQLGRPDVLAVGDLAVGQAFRKLYSLTPPDKLKQETAVQWLPGRKQMERIAEKWRPFRTIGTWYLWHVMETEEAQFAFGA
eukprot:TRINITY_DN19919_c0_g1_i1.p1 TRINITY_DN19919_c0_g1~~TRINITY_DN19919_c0_g1_i1.p1  ORF type:complete len:1957 (+),score=523.13 TRINITY_DN19919_c0_g1_i1:51-5873(+)